MHAILCVLSCTFAFPRFHQIAGRRKAQIGSGARSEKIRTYNFKDNRVSDHRIKQNYPLETFLEGNIEQAIQDMIADDQKRRPPPAPLPRGPVMDAPAAEWGVGDSPAASYCRLRLIWSVARMNLGSGIFS